MSSDQFTEKRNDILSECSFKLIQLLITDEQAKLKEIDVKSEKLQKDTKDVESGWIYQITDWSELKSVLIRKYYYGNKEI